MKLRGWSIDGFGIFRDHAVRDLPDGLTVIYGPNEAGKTTLLSFVRGVLFGFPDGRSTEPRYPPLLGGRHGGRLLLSGPAGEYVVDRSPGAGRRGVRVVLPGNREGGEDDLRDLIGPADRQLFRSVFAFSLAELQDFGTLTAQGLRDRIFSVGITGAGVSAREAIEELEERAGELLKLFRDLTERLEETQASLARAREAAESYPGLLLREETARGDEKQMGESLSQLEREARRLRKLIQVWPPYHRKSEAQRLLSELETIDTFPPDPETRIAQLAERIETRRGRLNELLREKDADEVERRTIQIDDRLAEVASEVRDLRDQVALYRDRAEKLGRAVLERQQAELILAQRLADLGPGWDEPRVQNFDRSIPRQEHIRAFEGRLAAAHDAARAATSQWEASRSNEQSLARDLERLEQVPVGTEPMSRGEIDERDGVLRGVRADLATLHEQQVELEHKEALANDRARALQLMRERDPWSPLKVGVAGAVAVVLLALGLRVGDSPQVLPVLAVGAAAVLALVVLQIRARRAHAKRIDEMQRELKNLEEGNSRRQQVTHALRQQIVPEGGVLNLSPDSTWRAVEEAERDLRSQVMGRERWDQRHSALSDAREKLARAADDSERCRTVAAASSSSVELVEREWRDWKSSMSLPDELSPQACLEFFRTIEEARNAANDATRARADEAMLDQEILTWQRRAREVAGSSDLDGERLVAGLVELAMRCEEDGEAREKADRLNDAIRRRTSQVEGATEALREAEEAYDELLREAGTTDEETFRQRLAIFGERDRLSAAVRNGEEQLTEQLGLGPVADALRDELASGELSKWQDELARVEPEIDPLRAKRDEALLEEGRARAEREAVEQSADIASIELERESLLKELTDRVREWQAVSLAKGLIQRTLEDFVRNRQPQVLAEASPTLLTITNGRYERVVQAQNAQDVLVMDGRGGTRGVTDLSRGTAEQLYLCLRLALATEFSKAGIDLPIVMDEILVNFDAARARTAAEILVEYARHRQVIVFTCHPETRDVFLAFDPAVRVLELAPVGPIAAPEYPEAVQESLLPLAEASGDASAAELGDELAERVLNMLDERSLALSEIVDQTGLNEADVSKMLRVLRHAGKVDVTGHARGARWQRVPASGLTG